MNAEEESKRGDNDNIVGNVKSRHKQVVTRYMKMKGSVQGAVSSE